MYPLPAKSPDEAKVVTFNFRTELSPGALVQTATVEKASVAGTDTGAAALSVASPIVADDGINVLVLVAGGTDRCAYSLKCRAQSDNGEVHDITARLTVDATAA